MSWQRAVPASAVVAGIGYWFFMSSYSQLAGRFCYRAETTERVVGLSFDDGPNEPYTSEIGDFLSSRSVVATFFQVGRCVERYPEATLRLVAQGHLIAAHSYSHRFSDCFSWRVGRRDIERGCETIAALVGTRPALFRPPWLLRYPAMLAGLRAQGIEPISGVFGDIFEVFQPSGARMAARALRRVRPGAILIFHDGFDARTGSRRETVAAVKILVDSLIGDGYRFERLDHLLAIPGSAPRSS
jgi:peptidoglycan/xylan/chitin deacetylase (PgdA/CDA1 family)